MACLASCLSTRKEIASAHTTQNTQQTWLRQLQSKRTTSAPHTHHCSLPTTHPLGLNAGHAQFLHRDRTQLLTIPQRQRRHRALCRTTRLWLALSLTSARCTQLRWAILGGGGWGHTKRWRRRGLYRMSFSKERTRSKQHGRLGFAHFGLWQVNLA